MLGEEDITHSTPQPCLWLATSQHQLLLHFSNSHTGSNGSILEAPSIFCYLFRNGISFIIVDIVIILFSHLQQCVFPWVCYKVVSLLPLVFRLVLKFLLKVRHGFIQSCGTLQ